MHLRRALLGLLPLAVAAQDQRVPVAVRKMLDGGDKFYPEQYLAFEADTPDDSSLSLRRSLMPSFFRRYRPARPQREAPGPRPLAVRVDTADTADTANASLAALLAPFAVHEDASYAVHPLARLQGRDWSCPTGTASCAGIGYPYSCCATDETCYEVDDVGLGPVGCCPTGETCSGSVTTCADGTTACSVDDGGGCCIAGYVCAGVGCVVSSASSSDTATAAATTVTSTSTVAVAATPSVVVVTVVVTQTASAGGVTTLTSTSTSTVTPTTTGAVAPVKPTSLPDSSSTTSTTSTVTTPASSASSASYCPIGYYACLALAGGGCCQTGRDCQTTSCPPASASSTVVGVNGITIVVPADATAAAAAAAATSANTCATGWFLCASDTATTTAAGAAAGCCPSGYSCGSASCTLAAASDAATATVQKELPSAASASARLHVAGWPQWCWLAVFASVLSSSSLL